MFDHADVFFSEYWRRVGGGWTVDVSYARGDFELTFRVREIM